MMAAKKKYTTKHDTSFPSFYENDDKTDFPTGLRPEAFN